MVAKVLTKGMLAQKRMNMKSAKSLYLTTSNDADLTKR